MTLRRDFDMQYEMLPSSLRYYGVMIDALLKVKMYFFKWIFEYQKL